jgi:energy-coupling factor transport system substrate-specific component
MQSKITKKILRQTGLALVLIAVYLVVAIPFKVMSVIPGFTDIRPVLLFKPVYGAFFGLPGCIAFAIGNLIGDIISDSLRWSSIAGLAANFIGPFMYWFFWNKISKTQFSLRNGKNLLKQLGVTIVSSALEAVLITSSVYFSYPEVDSVLLAVTVMLNDTIFPIFLGIPLIILMQEELNFKPKAFSL